MKVSLNKPLFVLFFVLLNFAALSSDAEKLFLEGNKFFQNKEYEKAIAAYEQLVNEGYEGTALYFNLGNAYYRTGKIGFAILFYEKALRLSPGDDDAAYNLTLANLRIIDRVESFPRFFLFEWWENLLSLFSISGWTVAAYVFYFLLLASVGYYFFTGNPFHQKLILISGILSLVLLIITSALLIIKLNRELNVSSGVIVEQSVNVKLSPDYKSNDAFIIHEGFKVIVEDEVDNWVRIKLPDGKVGWMPKEDLKVI
jgi:tetratricopeptide (TPR) repeat protein